MRVCGERLRTDSNFNLAGSITESHLRNPVSAIRSGSEGKTALPYFVVLRLQDASIRRFRDQPLELVTAVGTSKPSGQLDSHQQTPGSEKKRIGDATDVKLSDVTDKEVSNY